MLLVESVYSGTGMLGCHERVESIGEGEDSHAEGKESSGGFVFLRPLGAWIPLVGGGWKHRLFGAR